MAIMKFGQALVVAQAALFFGTNVFAKKMYLTNRSAFANTTTSATPSATITHKPSFTMSTGSFDLAACPSTDGEEWYDCWRPEDPQEIGFDPISPYNTTAYPYNIVPPDPSVASLCGSLWTSSASAFFSTASISTNTEFGWVLFEDQNWEWVPSEPCCLNCTLVGGAITVMVWPTPAPTPAVSTLVDTANNFTFISPSVYVAFDSIGATDMCGSVGPSFTNKTIGFEPDALSTQRNFYAASIDDPANDLNQDYCTHATPNGLWQTFDYEAAAKGQCTEITTSWWSYYYSNDTTMYSNEAEYAAATDISCGLGCIGQPTDEFTCVYNPCSPWVSVPTQLYDLNQKFHTCVDGIKAFFDPPYTLTQGNGLVAFSAVPASSSSPAPAQTPAPALASPTPTPIPNTPTPTPTPSPDPPSPSADPPSPSSNSAPADPQPVSSTPSVPNDPAPTTGDASPDPSPNSSPSPIAVVGGVTVSQDPSSNIVVGSQTITPGGPAVTSNGHTFSVAPSATALIIDGSTSAIPNYTPPTAAAVGILTTAANGATGLVIAGGQTITAGGSPVTVAGTTYSLAPGGSAVVVNGVTSPVPTAGPHIVTSAGTPLLVVGSQTILPGSSAVIVGGTTYSLASSGNALVVDGTSQYIIGSQTLVAGGSAITVSGTVISLLGGGQSVVVGGTTEPITSLLRTGSSGLGGAILTIGGFTTATGGYNGTVFTGGVGKVAGGRWVGREVLCVGLLWMTCLGAVWVL